METDDSVRSKPRKSEECFSRECDACATEGLIKEATFFCPKCEERLCNSCESWHNKLKATRSHRVLPVTEAPQHLLTDNSITAESFRIPCDCGGESDLLYFCKNHETVVCSSCRSIKHWKCKISTVEYLSRKQNISERFDEITDKTD